MLWEQRIEYAAHSDVGLRRRNNQDSWSVQLCRAPEDYEARGHLFVVADGMGGHAVGELASKLAVDIIPHTFDKLRELSPAAALKQAIETANTEIHERGAKNADFLHMGTTCTSLLLCPDGAWIGHVGDSRVYRVRQGVIDQLTRDHSLVWELIAQRKVHPSQAERLYPRNIITRSLGPEANVAVDLEGPIPVYPGDSYIICSDGLSTLVRDSEIGMIAAELPVAEACRLLVHLANLRGGSDNITAIVVRTEGAFTETRVVAVRPTTSISWTEFAVWCGMVLGILAGFSLVALSNHVLPGAILLTLSCAAAGGWLARQVTRSGRQSRLDPLSTIVWRPYRTEAARLTIEFAKELAHYAGELRRAAQEDRWVVDWAKLDAHQAAARDNAAGKQTLAQAVREYSRIIDHLMTAAQQQQRRPAPTQRVGGRPTPGSMPVIDIIEPPPAAP